MRTQEEIRRDNINAPRYIQDIVDRRLILEVLLDIRELLSKDS